ncbi:MAG: BF3164 family lipoprotein, partial [Bacteroidales bacterium]
GEIINEFRLSGKQNFPYATIDPDATEDDILSLTENYFKVKSTKEYIYALYAGETKGELYPDLFAGPFTPSDFGQEIHVWTWQGEPVKSIKLDKRLFSFDVCPEDKCIVGISLSEPDYLFEFRID